MYKKISKISLSILLCGALASNSFAAGTLWDSDSIFSNATSANIATDPNTGSTYMSGGGIEVRFKRNGNYPPIFSVDAPSVKASCRGISFDAGYATFMNLERLGQQLSQAGASVAYGVLIGLVYTLPGVEQAFSKLNQWSQWLQGFLSDSCNIGQNFGRSLGGDGSWTGLKGVSDDINGGIPSPSEYIDKNPDSTIAIAMKKIADSGTATQKQQAKALAITHFLTDVRGGFISTFLNTQIKKNNDSISFPTTNIGVVQSLDGSGFSQSTLMNAYFLSALMDNTAISDAGIRNVLKNLDGSNAEKVAAMFESVNKDKSLKSIMKRNNMSGKDLANFMMNGAGTSGVNFKGLNIAVFNIPEGTGVKEQFVVLTDETNSTVTTAFDNFEGYIGESKKLIYHNYNKMVQQLQDSGASNPIQTTSLKVSVMSNEINEILRTLVLYHGKKITYDVNASSDPEITNVLQYLAYDNAVRLAKMSLDNINSVIRMSTTDMLNRSMMTGATSAESVMIPLDKENTKDLNEQKKKFEDAIKEIEQQLEEIDKKISSEDRLRRGKQDLKNLLQNKNLGGGKK